MRSEFKFNTKVIFENAVYDEGGQLWLFYFSDKVYASSSGFWRLLENNKIFCVSLDHQQQFGHPKQIDLVEIINDKLRDKYLLEIEVKKSTFDLLLTLTDNLILQIFISSSGFETYDFSINAKRYIGLGSGDICII